MNEDNQNYTMRPLTAEERAFAADERNYNLLDYYMYKRNLDKEEWYDILIIPYLNAVKKYHECERLQKYAFSTILFKTLNSAFSHHFISLRALKRTPKGGIFSLDCTLEGDKSFSKYSFDELLEDHSTDVEDEIMEMELLAELLENLSVIQQKITQMKIYGYENKEVYSMLKIKPPTYYKELGRVKSTLESMLKGK